MLLQLLAFDTPGREFRVQSEASVLQVSWWDRSLDRDFQELIS